MRLEGLVWFILGGIVLILGLYYVVVDVFTQPAMHSALSFGLFLGFVAFFFMGLGLIMIIKEIVKSLLSSKK